MGNDGSVGDQLSTSGNVTKEGSKMSITGYARILLVGSLVGAAVLSLASPSLSREKASQCPRLPRLGPRYPGPRSSVWTRTLAPPE